jgi:DNA-directed RNA polymerase specialized sigma24 family protein
VSLANYTFFLLKSQKNGIFTIMSFPQTRETLVFRIAAKGDERAWGRFLSDYWLPVCRFAQQQDGLSIEDAEDTASQTFEVMLCNQLLQRWAADRSSKLRTLLCTVVRHVLGNRARMRKRRQRLLRENLHKVLERTDLSMIKATSGQAEHVDEFYAAWVDSILLQTLKSLMREYESRGKADYLRVLHGRVCEKMTIAQVSRALGVRTTSVRSHYKAACKRLETKLRQLVYKDVLRYCDLKDLSTEFDSEWCKIGQHLKERGGLEQAVAKVYQSAGLVELADRQAQAVALTSHGLAQALPEL